MVLTIVLQSFIGMTRESTSVRRVRNIESALDCSCSSSVRDNDGNAHNSIHGSDGSARRYIHRSVRGSVQIFHVLVGLQV